jgi:hypothetical protein
MVCAQWPCIDGYTACIGGVWERLGRLAALAGTEDGGIHGGSVKQAAEFGITQTGQNLAGMLLNINDIHALGLEAARSGSDQRLLLGHERRDLRLVEEVRGEDGP